MSGTRGVVGIIGGTGVDRVLDGGATKTHRVATPWGAPSAPIVEGMLGDDAH